MPGPDFHHDSPAEGSWALRLACLFSGGAALVFENTWFRAAGLVLGNSIWSAAVVVAAFMAGLGLGNFITAAMYRRIRNLGRAYVWTEVAIAVAGLGCFLFLFHGQAAIAAMFSPWQEHPLVLQILRSLIALAVLVVPAVGIGATLPLLVGVQTRRPFAVKLAELYAWNTLGAVVGSLACEFVLVDLVGVPWTAVIAGGGNLAAAALVWFLHPEPRPVAVAAGTPERPPRDHGPADALPDAVSRLLWPVLLSGLNLLALEVLWFRFLQLFFNGTAKTFAIMLALVLAGLSLGGAVAARLSIQGPRERLIRWLCLVAGGLVVVTYALFPHALALVTGVVSSEARGLVLLSAFLMVPLCALSGALYALIGAELNEHVRHHVRSTGLLTLANTIGAMLGPLLAAFVLLPLLGVERSFFLMAALYGVAAFLLRPRAGFREYLGRRPLVQLGGFGAILIVFPFGQMTDRFHQGVARRLPEAKLVHTHEGLTETSFYFRHDSMGRPFYHRLVTHGYSMSASDPKSKRYMKLYAWLPLALRPEMESALLICFGVGSTARALTDTPALRRIDVVDISRDILRQSDLLFPPPERHPLKDPRVRTWVEDGRFYLETTPRTYDLITGEPPPPKIAGVVNLYTEEFFRLVRSRLNEGGYCSYWLPVYQMQPAEARSIIRAFLNVFPEGTLWEGGGLNWMLLGQRGRAPRPAEEAFVRQWKEPALAAEMASLGLETPGQLGATFLADAPALERFCAGAPALTDARPHRLSTDMRDRAPGSSVYRELVDPDQARVRFESSTWIRENLPPEIRTATLPWFQVQRFLNYALFPQYRPDAEALAQDAREVLRTTSLRTLPAWMVGSSPQEIAIARELAGAGKATAEVEFHLSAGELADRNYPAAAEHMRASIRKNSGGAAPSIDVLARTLGGL